VESAARKRVKRAGVTKEDKIMVIYQICPKCKGQGTVSKPPWVDGDINTWSSSGTNSYICNVCHGAKIIPTLQEKYDDEIFEDME